MAKTDKLSEKMQPVVDRILMNNFKNVKEILRPNWDMVGDAENNTRCMLDKEYGIDAQLIQTNKGIITVQDKVRSNVYLKRGDFTFEYHNDYENNIMGEWSKGIAQYYFYGWTNESETDFEKWYILDLGRLRDGLNDWRDIDILPNLQVNGGKEKASFCPFNFDGVLSKLDGVIVYQSE